MLGHSPSYISPAIAYMAYFHADDLFPVSGGNPPDDKGGDPDYSGPPDDLDDQEDNIKFKFEVMSNLDSNMVIKLVIEESTVYQSPASITSEAFQSLPMMLPNSHISS
ncbi:hypothetical protein EV702DRAFT_1199774 [Suillus placidus]|uniref:Uncharacterized protein n=1 Tax=Suillus placidus TaxID=48579 RepID=A0A9P6ZQP2_9AGAM|nr:hypothetical protein EV702DRAFT_1199774 [Suillus placidus]